MLQLGSCFLYSEVAEREQACWGHRVTKISPAVPLRDIWGGVMTVYNRCHLSFKPAPSQNAGGRSSLILEMLFTIIPYHFFHGQCYVKLIMQNHFMRDLSRKSLSFSSLSEKAL